MASARLERHREQEFYRYYHPVLRRSHSGSLHVDPADPEAAAQHVPRSSPDIALTAFCQLGALRMGMRRCMIFSFDAEYAYVLAEATRTLSLQDDNIHDIDDSLWLGHSVLPRGLSVCEHTINIPEANKGSNQCHADAGRVHIINNLQEDVRFCDRPYVANGPKARFYAGVPLISPAGIRIGAYCVLDDKPHDGITPKEVDFLCQMSKTVMDHLEIVRSSSEFGTGSQMLTSLAKFFRATDLGEPSTPTTERTEHLEGDDVSNCGPGHSEPQELSKENLKNISEKDFALRKISSHSPPRNSKAVADDEVGRTYKTAARLIREAADADGVMFLEPSARRFHQDTPASSTWGSANGAESNTSEVTTTDGEPFTDSDGKPHTGPSHSRVLGQCERVGNQVKPKGLSARLLRHLLQHYPEGKVWLFNAAGEASSESHDSASDSGYRTGIKSGPGARNKVSRVDELRASFPGVRALCLVGMFDPARENAYAGCLIWSNEPSRVFSPAGELSYVRAFCEVVTSNIARIEMRRSDEMKTQFISSVSHELRSPLHGIIGSIDLLQEQQTIDWSIILQIEKCSLSLMDVIDHLLDFSKINNLGTSQQPNTSMSKSRHRTRRQNSEYTKTGERGKIKLHSLSQTTAEISDVVYYSYCHSAGAKQRGQVDFILDVSTDLALGYTVPVGSWKRICMNLINNALKYTTEGYVMVTLRILEDPRKVPIAVLTVKDTGCGMAQEFLEQKLFRAFTQEDNLSVGTGLGMSLVAKLVKGLGGKIEVRSVKDVGTTVKVKVPLDVQVRPVTAKATITPLQGLRVRMLASPPAEPSSQGPQSTQRQLHLNALHRTLRHLGVVLIDDDGPAVDLLWEADLHQYSQSPDQQARLAPAVLVLCDSVMSATHVRGAETSDPLRRVEYVSRPFGPDRMLEALIKCCDAPQIGESNSATTTTITKNDVDAKRKAEAASDDSERRPSATRVDSAQAHEVNRKNHRMSLWELADRKSSIVRGGSTESIDESPDESPVSTAPTTATLELEAPDDISRTPSPESPSVDTPSEKLSLLLVDDNPINLRLLTTYAQRNSHPWVTASDGAQAVEAYKSSTTAPQVIFMDINMPIMDGFEASRRIRAHEKASGLTRSTIVALTGLGSAEAREEAEKSGVDVFLTKPVRPKELKVFLGEIEEGRRNSAP